MVKKQTSNMQPILTPAFDRFSLDRTLGALLQRLGIRPNVTIRHKTMGGSTDHQGQTRIPIGGMPDRFTSPCPGIWKHLDTQQVNYKACTLLKGH
jgi:hypothetical protein